MKRASGVVYGLGEGNNGPVLEYTGKEMPL